MQTNKSADRQLLITAINDGAVSAHVHVKSATDLLIHHGASERNVPIIRAVIRRYEKDPDPGIVERALKLRVKLNKRLGLNKVDDGDDLQPTAAAASIASSAITDLPIEKAPLDLWDSEPPLPTEEAFRLLEVERPYELHLSQLPKDLRPTATSNWVLKPGANVNALIEKALDERPRTIASLQRLYRHMALSFSRGGCVLTDGPLYSEIKKILTKANALPELEKVESVFEKLERQYQENERKEKHQ